MSRKSFRVGKSKTGLGLFATRLIGKGEFIVQYRGKRLTNEEADKRADRGNKYLYELNSRWTIDGKSRKNVARYANHSCRPNAESDVIRGKKIIIRSIKRIQPDEEITYDYGKDYYNLILKPIGCKCPKCVEKRRLERAEKRLKAKRKRAREAKKAAQALELIAARARKLKARVDEKARTIKVAAKSARRGEVSEPQRKAA